MSVLYCTIPHFAAALARRDDAALRNQPLVLTGPEGRVLALSAEAATCGITAGLTAQEARVRCPEARMLETDAACYRAETEVLYQLLEECSSRVEPHGWGAAYVELEELTRDSASAVALCREVGQAVRRELGESLQPALGWDSSKFTAQTAARCTPPGRLRAVEKVRERMFLQPLPINLLPLAGDTLQRLCFLGLRTLGQYAALPPAAVWQQFGRAGKMAHRCARGDDDRPVVPRWQAPRSVANLEFETPLAEREQLIAVLRHLVSPLLADLRGNLQACGQIRLALQFDDGSVQERERTFLLPTTSESRVVRVLESLLDGMSWPAKASALSVTLEQIQDIVAEQLALFPLQDERQEKIQEVQRYLASRFGKNSLRRAVISQPSAPLPEWRIEWLAESEP